MRHEALIDFHRVRCETSPEFLSQQGFGSWRQPEPGGAGEGGSSLDNVAGTRHCQTRWPR